MSRGPCLEASPVLQISWLEGSWWPPVLKLRHWAPGIKVIDSLLVIHTCDLPEVCWDTCTWALIAKQYRIIHKVHFDSWYLIACTAPGLYERVYRIYCNTLHCFTNCPQAVVLRYIERALFDPSYPRYELFSEFDIIIILRPWHIDLSCLED